MEHPETAQVAALAGALGATLALLPRDRFSPLLGIGLLGLGSLGLLRSLVADDDLRLLLAEPTGLALLATGAVGVVLAAVPLARYPGVVPVALLAAAPFRVPVELGSERAFLLLPLYFVIAASGLALGYRVLRGARPPGLPLLLAAPLTAFVTFASVSFLWTWDERAGGIALAFFLFPFTAGLAMVARAPLAPWLPRGLLLTLAALGTLFATIGIWQAQTRTVFFARDVEVANAYATFFRVTSLFKDPSLYGRYLVVPIVVLLVALLFRRGRTIEWVALTGLVGLLFWGLFYSYSQSSFVALFVTAFALALVGASTSIRVALVACALAATLAAAAFAAQAIEGRSAREVTSGRSRLVEVTLEAFVARPLIGVGIGGQPRASTELSGRGSPARNASHTTPLTVLADLGVVGIALYLWLLAAAAWALRLVARRDRLLGLGLAAVLGALLVHSLLYAGFFEDPLTWGALGLAAAALASPAPSSREHRQATLGERTPEPLAH
ncbi:MAG: O-antigen ligase family protein [Thermoleophilia bacterium]|nr:O-antigen ligase family protein [Gaiellaceae bacterium]MDW8338178.1 O-antigen ligase family protein [Thermoleophilia bacterium]